VGERGTEALSLASERVISLTRVGKLSRNAPCPCGSGLKYKRCCLGKEDLARLFAQAVALPIALPLLRPDGEAFEAWANTKQPAGPDGAPPKGLIDEGIDRVEEEERERIVEAAARAHPKLWQRLCEETGDEDLLRSCVLYGAVLAALREERSLDPDTLDLIEEESPDFSDPVEALAVAIESADIWSQVDAISALRAFEAMPENASEKSFGRRWRELVAEVSAERWSDRHERRLRLLVERIRSQLPFETHPLATAALQAACKRLDQKEKHFARLAAMLLADAATRCIMSKAFPELDLAA